LNCAIISFFDPVIDGTALGTDGSAKGASSIVFRDDGAGFVSTSASWFGASGISSRRGVCPLNSGIGGDGADFKIGGVAVGAGEGVDVDFGVGVGVGVATSVGIGDGVWVAIGVWVGKGVGVSVGVEVGVTIGVKNGVGLGFDRVGERNGIGVGKISDSCVGGGSGGGFGVATGVSLGLAVVADAAGVDVSFGFGVTVGAGVGARSSSADPGSDQPPTLSPLANFACKLVPACSLTTMPSNFPATILPV